MAFRILKKLLDIFEMAFRNTESGKSWQKNIL